MILSDNIKSMDAGLPVIHTFLLHGKFCSNFHEAKLLRLGKIFSDKSYVLWYNKLIDYGGLCPKMRHSRK